MVREVKMIKMLCVISLSSLLLSANVFSASVGENYFGASYHNGAYEEDGLSTLKPAGLSLKIGTYIADNVSLEGRFLFGLSSDDSSIFVPGFGVVDFEFELDSAISLFSKGDIPISSSVNIYGIAGFTKAEFTVTVFDTTVSDDESGFSYGFGAEIAVDSDIFIAGEYIVYIDEDTYEYSGINIGFTKLF